MIVHCRFPKEAPAPKANDKLLLDKLQPPGESFLGDDDFGQRWKRKLNEWRATGKGFFSPQKKDSLTSPHIPPTS
jgi:hypothetical protein